MPSRGIPAVLLPLAALVLAACARPDANPDKLDPKLALTTYIEEGKILALVVSTRAARFRQDRPYLPLEIAVVNKGLANLTITTESFKLVDDEGNSYPVVGREELAREYGNTDVDRNFAEAAPLVRQKFAAYRQVASNLTPGFNRPIGRRISLPRFTYILDFVYFPLDRTEAREKILELELETPELENPIFVRFRI